MYLFFNLFSKSSPPGFIKYIDISWFTLIFSHMADDLFDFVLKMSICYLGKGCEEPLKVIGEFSESSSLSLSVTLCANLYQSGQTRLQPAHVPLLQFSIVSQTLQIMKGRSIKISHSCHIRFLPTSSLFLTSMVDLTCPNLLWSPALFRRSLSWLSFDVTQAESSENLQTHTKYNYCQYSIS